MEPSFNDQSSMFTFVVKDGNGIKGLVDSGLKHVPGRYIQPPEQQIDKQQVVASSEVMTIDISELNGPNRDQVVKAIGHAAETLGFFQVVNHGVPLELLESLKAAGHRFFSQPVEKKAMYLKEVSPSPTVKYATSFNPDVEKVMEWRDYVSMTYTNDADVMEFWPDDFKEVVLEYIKTSKEMVKTILQALITNLQVKVDDSRLDKLIGLRTVFMNFYPTCPNPDLTIGMGRHSDLGLLTVLLQDGVGGLYIQKGESSSPDNEEWIEVPPINGAFVINIGDALQILSNGRYKSAIHRVGTTNIAPRVSVPIFNAPLPMENIGPIPELVARDGVARYRELTFQEYKTHHFGKAHGGKKSLEFASI